MLQQWLRVLWRQWCRRQLWLLLQLHGSDSFKLLHQSLHSCGGKLGDRRRRLPCRHSSGGRRCCLMLPTLQQGCSCCRTGLVIQHACQLFQQGSNLRPAVSRHHAKKSQQGGQWVGRRRCCNGRALLAVSRLVLVVRGQQLLQLRVEGLVLVLVLQVGLEVSHDVGCTVVSCQALRLRLLPVGRCLLGGRH